MALERQGRYEEALAAFSAAILCDNDDVYAWNNRAVILARLDRPPQEAALACRQALTIDRSCIFALVTYGMVLGRLGNYHEAENVLAVAEDLDPQARALYPGGDSTMTRA